MTLTLMVMRKLPTVILLFVVALVSSSEPPEPRLTADHQLIRPEGYREWMFVGSGLGMGYSEEAPRRPAHFTNVYLQPEAYRGFVATGRFPDQTTLVMEILTPGSKASINQQGQFEDQFVGIQAAVKDTQRFPEKWAYFTFIGSDGKPLEQAKAFPKKACWQCHNQHGAVDNVFVQFYPVLRDARKNRSATEGASPGAKGQAPAYPLN